MSEVSLILALHWALILRLKKPFAELSGSRFNILFILLVHTYIELTTGRPVLSMPQVVTNLILTTALLIVFAHPHFTGEETEAQKGHTPSFCN